ncbi:MAG: hypothetical protein MUO85_11010, partial [candidate division Zixibacteria bacterium]|nr:hypothetical protein [candidate division Zixibacteria bacterium]
MNEGLCWWQFAVKYLPYIITAGIPLLVFALARILDKRKENQRKHGTYIALCHAIYVNLKTNLDYLGQIHARIFVGSYPSFRLRLSQKDSILNVIIPLCEDWGLLEKIEHAYDELDHIHSRMEEQLEMKQDADDKSIQGGPYRQNVDALNAAIHIRESLKPYRAGTV